MKKNDKLIAIIGVVILIIASIGISMWTPPQNTQALEDISDVIGTTGHLATLPTAVSVSDNDPFFPLIATPITINYDQDSIQAVRPLFVMDPDNPSNAVLDLHEDIELPISERIDDSMDAKNWSLYLAEKYWESSDAALIIEYNQSGYELGVLAVPMASYLSIPVIVTNEMDTAVNSVLGDLGVEKTLICGDLEGYGEALHYTTAEQIVYDTIDVVREKFGRIDYLTLTNPLDAFPPEVLDEETYYFGPTSIRAGGTVDFSHLLGMGVTLPDESWTFEIPIDYKYVLVKFEGINHEVEHIDDMGDNVAFYLGANIDSLPDDLEMYELFAGTTSGGGIPVRDDQGNIIEDKVTAEAVVYDRGGVEYSIRAKAQWLTITEGDISAKVTVQKLSNPLYPLMKNLSTTAPYLTAYRQGIIYGKPDFAFAADDDVLNDRGETCPGFYLPRRNPELAGASNDHIYDNIHLPINDLLGYIASIHIERPNDLEYLRNYYADNPINIAIVAGGTMIPNYLYQNWMEPIDVEDAPYFFGAGTPSDVIYGNIDPPAYKWDGITNDIYSEYPFQENIVSRVTGWDSQDTSALIGRTIYYDTIISNLGNWKDNFAVLIGGGQDFQKPLLRYFIFGDLLGLTPHGEPMKIDTGYGYICGERTESQIVEEMGFNSLKAYSEAAQAKGFSDQALDELKSQNLFTKLLLSKNLLKGLVGEGVTYGGEYMENSNYIWANAHGQQHLFGMAGPELTATGWAYRIGQEGAEIIVPLIGGGFLGPGSSYSAQGDYGTRTVEGMDFGPSFMWLESCICGKIDGMDPRTSVGQALLHSGVTSLVASPTGSNIGGGYLEPKNRMYDNPFSVWRAKRQAFKDAENDVFPDPHFGYLIYTDMCAELEEHDSTAGLAFRNAKNAYLPQDADWELWWAPPLVQTGDNSIDSGLMDYYLDLFEQSGSSGKGTMIENKYTSYYEYMLFGDPAFNPYEPHNEGYQ